MNYSEPLSQQIVVFVKAVGSGIFIGVVYDLIYTVRSIISDKKSAIIAQDIIFGVLTSIISFFFMVLFGGGIVRLNLIIAQAAGAVAFHFSVGRSISSVLISVGGTVKKAVNALLYPFKYAGEKLSSLITAMSSTVRGKAGTIKIKIAEKRKKSSFEKKEEDFE